jgi:hypothetical protein
MYLDVRPGCADLAAFGEEPVDQPLRRVLATWAEPSCRLGVRVHGSAAVFGVLEAVMEVGAEVGGGHTLPLR